MHLARVIGTVVATTVAPGLEGIRLLVLQPVNRRLEPWGGAVVAADAVNTAGPDELVYFVSSREAAVAMPETFVPVDHAVIGIVDQVREVTP